MKNLPNENNLVHIYRKIIVDETLPEEAIAAFCTAYSNSRLQMSGGNGAKNNVSYVSDERVSPSIDQIISYLLSQSVGVDDVVFNVPSNVPSLQRYETKQGSCYFILRRPLNQEEYGMFLASFSTYAKESS